MSSKATSGEVFSGGATTSQHIDAENDDHFENTTFKLKRTRSLGLLDDYIEPTEKAKEGQTNENVPPEENNSDKIKGQKKLSIDTLNSKDDHNEAHNNDDEFNNASKLRRRRSSGSVDDHGPSSMSLKSPEVLPHDDTDMTNEPSSRVDYLSHQWDVSDISKSWRYVTQKRKDVPATADHKDRVIAARLENASWRTWAQRRSNLKTISPETLNWYKVKDVDWLYGPILRDEGNDIDHDEEDDSKRVTTATSAVAGDISIPQKKRDGPKPILKRKTVQDMVISQFDLSKLQVATNKVHQQQEEARLRNAQANHEKKKSGDPIEFDDYDAISAKLNSQYATRNNSQSSVPLQQSDSREMEGPPMTSINSMDKLSLDSPKTVNQDNRSRDNETASEDRHIHFNEEVKQCIAVDSYDDEDYDDEDDDSYYYENEDYEDEDGYMYESQGDMRSSNNERLDPSGSDESDDDDEGGFFLQVNPPSSCNLGPPNLSLSDNRESTTNDNTEDTDTISTENSKVYKTIHLLPSTTINYGSSDEEDSSDGYPGPRNFNNNSSKGFDYLYDYNSVYTVDPKHAIYGKPGNGPKQPDVVDVPKDIEIGSNMDYEFIENGEYNRDYPRMPIINPALISSSNPNYLRSESDGQSEPEPKSKNSPISSVENSGSGGHSIFQNDDADNSSDESSDDGLSIATRSSSQSLAQSVFGQMSRFTDDAGHGDISYPENHPEPKVAPITDINPRHSSTSISKQPHSSNSLSEQFFGSGGLSKSESASLADQFLNPMSKQEEAKSENDQTHEAKSLPHTAASTSKTSPLPPQTSSATAFRGMSSSSNSSGSVKSTKKSNKGAFNFDSGSSSDSNSSSGSESNSESDSDSESILNDDDVSGTSGTNGSSNEQGKSYASLSQVADRNGIRSPTPTDVREDIHNSSPSTIMNQAKGLANHLLGRGRNTE